jgi:adenosylcobinamide-phosphate synthase
VGFFAFFVVLLLDQARPLSADDRLRRWFGDLVDLVRTSTDAGQAQQGWVGWAVVAVSVCGVMLAIEWLAHAIHPLVEWLFHVAVLYLVIGFRQTSAVITEMQVALALDDVQGARRVFDRWRSEQGAVEAPGSTLPADAPIEEVCRETIVTALVNLHRGICAPLLWYLLLPGVLGPLLYWVSGEMARRWGRSTIAVSATPRSDGVLPDLSTSAGSAYGEAALRIHRWLDWLPVRFTAAGFAVAGNFDDAVYCWRGAVASGTGSDQRTLLLAAASGATGLKLADSALETRWAGAAQSFEWPGRSVDSTSLRLGMRLIYRSTALWLGLFALLGLASWLGR